MTDPLGTIGLSYKTAATYNEDNYSIPMNILNEEDKEYKWASAVVLFGMKLKKSPAVKNIKWDYLINYCKQIIDSNNYEEAELLNLVQTAKKVYAKEKRFNPFGWLH